jgi:hypothetical protein
MRRRMYHLLGGDRMTFTIPDETISVVRRIQTRRKRVLTNAATPFAGPSSDWRKRPGLRTKKTKVIPPTSIAAELV